ncbi:hypothetical protein [Magnetovibrio sp.]|uniref:hypothetical protein n=1 Tax=Magnetovibrio sp. TaxID=2024836 RepID=UPI002F9394B0
MKADRVATVSLLALLYGAQAWAGEADVLDVRAAPAPGGIYRFDVTVRHADEGWDHYADAYDIVAPDGTVLGTRILAHPHVDEQPFTRSLGGVRIPPNVTTVAVRAHDMVHGLGGRTQHIQLPERGK